MSSDPVSSGLTSFENEKRQSRFATTSWTVVLQASANDSEQKNNALEVLCEAYWYPLYAFVRRQGNSPTDAEDLTQSFFAELLAKSKLAKTDPNRGRFRSFLLTSLHNFLRNEHRNATTTKRGGNRSVLSLDFEAAESQFSLEPAHEATPQKSFDRNWAVALLNQVLGSLEQQYSDSGKSELFAALKNHLIGTESAVYSQLANQLDMKQGAIKVAMHRLRERYGQMLRLQIAKTIADPADVDQELKYLFEVLRG